MMTFHLLVSWMPTVLRSNAVPTANAELATSLFQIGGTTGTPVLGWLLGRKGMLPVGASYLIGVALILLIGHTASVPLLMALVFAAGSQSSAARRSSKPHPASLPRLYQFDGGGLGDRRRTPGLNLRAGDWRHPPQAEIFA
jgi:hypothetical protein